MTCCSLSTRAEGLIAELREISRLDSGKQLPRRGHFSAGQLFQALAQEFQPSAQLYSLDLRVIASSAWLYSDQSLLHRILQNLLANALKYTGKGRVVLGLRRRPHGAEIQVLDTGPGIAEQDQVRIFHEFERLQHQSGQGEEGLGLGLAIVQRYAELLGHKLQLQSIRGQGTMFSVTVTYGQPQASVQGPEEEVVGRDLEGLQVLCLDNDPLILDGMEQLLLTMGATVATARDRAEMFERLGSGLRPDIVLADYHLNDNDTGLDAMLAARKQGLRDTPCIIISADDSDVIRDRARAVGYRFLPKPVNAGRLRALVLALSRS